MKPKKLQNKKKESLEIFTKYGLGGILKLSSGFIMQPNITKAQEPLDYMSELGFASHIRSKRQLVKNGDLNGAL